MKKYIVFLIVFALIEIALALYLTYWRENFWQSVSLKDASEFTKQLIIFTVAALGICFTSGVSGYLVSLTAIKWRENINEKASAVREQDNIENFSQRQQEDARDYPDLVLNVGYGFVKSIVYILVFSVSLLLSFSFWLFAILLGYTIIGTLITHFIAKPLIKLNYDSQRAEATYRNNLNIENFGDCIRIMLGLAKKQKHLTYFQQFYGQVGVVLPLVIIAPIYFTTGMTLGMLMRFNSVSATILDNMSYGITSFAQINRLISCRKRLKEAAII